MVRGLSVRAIAAIVLVALSLAFAGTALAASPQEELADARAIVRRALVAARAGDVATATREYRAYDSRWLDIEDGVRAASREAYREIEARMRDVEVALAAAPADAAAIAAALDALAAEQQLFVDGKPPSVAA